MVVDAESEWYSSRLPDSYYQPEVLTNLAPDAQLYYSCPACGRHWRVNPSLRGDPPAGFACPCAPRNVLDPMRLRPRVVFLCRDCSAEYANFANPWDRPGRCPRCLSRKSMFWSAKSGRRIPDVFFSAPPLYGASKAIHRWNADAAADLGWLAAELELILDLPEAERHLIPTALFAARLRAVAGTDPDRVALMNFEATALRESYKLTTDITAGWTALRLYLDAAAMVRGKPLAEARITLNVARAAYSLLAIKQPLVLAATEEGELLRVIGLSAAERSIVLRGRGIDDSDAADAPARVWHLMGDICATGSSQETLVEASQHYDEALARPGLPVAIRESIVASQKRVKAQLARSCGTDGV
ncbi:hypothetical protein AB0D57_30875 [Streptomyces sp. NPDC048275]|uniref:hypothetical protein n=1 Tax=Streptomyces sp. NPDC048275 TaxID=3155629 RepID=UPI0033CCBE6D